MPAYTTVLGLYKPGGGSTGLITPDEPVDIDKLNGNFDLIDGAVGVGRWASGSRPTTPFKNQTGYNSTLDTIEQWNGTAWVTVLPNYLQPPKFAGYHKITPTAVSGGTIDTNGDAVGTATAGMRLDGVINFNQYKRYRLVVSATGNSVATTGIYVSGSFAGVPETGTTFWAYTRTVNNAGTSSSSAVTSQNAGQLAPPGISVNTLYAADAILGKFDGTNRAYLDVISGVSAGGSSQSQTAHIDYFTSKDLLTMDGLQINPGTGTANLRVAVYALD